jgi:hypothetical protein
MKKQLYKTFAFVLMTTGSLTACIDETLPESGYLAYEQIEGLTSTQAGYARAIAGYLGQPESCYDTEYDIGYPGLGLIRDLYCEDLSTNSLGYEYFYYWAANSYLGSDYPTAFLPWKYYYKWIANTSNILRGTENDDNKAYFGIAHFYRAWAYFDLARLYEYRNTGIASLDQAAAANGIYGLTVPILSDEPTDAEAFNTPRVKYYTMYRFLLDELEAAERELADYTRSAKNMPNIAVVYGLKARVYLEMATRYEFAPEDLTETLQSGVDLGFTTQEEAYALAAEYARKAINESGATPLSESEWYGGSNYTDGFNNVNTNAWMLGIIINKELLSASSWRNFIGYISPEQCFGVAGISYNEDAKKYVNTYGAQRLISTRLYDKISDKDWRKQTWIAPEDAGLAPGTKYKTIADDDHFVQIPAYSGLKFRPKEGNKTDFSVGAAADYPLMRVEEMYFIEAEAKAGSEGVEAGMAVLSSFLNTYRYRDNGYTTTASNIEQFREELMVQKRIEFWGEGLIFWDYKRLLMNVTRGYSGTNFPTYYRLNSVVGYYVAPWFNAFIPQSEYEKNSAMLPNPDPSATISAWEEN